MIRAMSAIKEHIGEEFKKLRMELGDYIDPNADVGDVRQMLTEDAPISVVARANLLLDTLLNYLMKDAIEALADASPAIKNEFYDLDLRQQVKKAFIIELGSPKISFDPRVLVGSVAAGVLAMAGILATALLPWGLLGRIVGSLATVGASAVAFKRGFGCKPAATWARERLTEDLDKYLILAEQRVTSWLVGVENFFGEEFGAFLERTDGEVA